MADEETERLREDEKVGLPKSWLSVPVTPAGWPENAKTTFLVVPERRFTDIEQLVLPPGATV
jgi:hypothetical protein